MARILNLNVVFKSQPLKTVSVTRFKSTISSPSYIEIDVGSDPDIEAITSQIEDAVHSIYVQRSAPDWLPFVPGSSFWVPPSPLTNGKKRSSSLKAAGELVRMVKTTSMIKRLSEEEEMAFTSVRGWPKAAYFFEGNPVKKRPDKAKVQSDDDE